VQYLLPLLVAVALAKSVGNKINMSIYDLQIKKKRFPFLHDRLKFKSRSGHRENAVMCEQIMATKVRVLGLSESDLPQHRRKLRVERPLRGRRGRCERKQLPLLLVIAHPRMQDREG
jgi:hypothetical protein